MKILKLSPREIEDLMDAAAEASFNQRDFRVAVDGSGFKYKVGGGMWTPPVGVDDQR